ncbi:MAG: hypothetical protein L3J23_09000 [Flavobacteriaceae bacterium]|nr:hypothetical protein [Flavobacteriaceae bacterium]
MKKFWLLFALLIGPLLFYLLILLIDINATFLPVLNKEVIDVSSIEPKQNISFKNHINIVGFLGEDLLHKKTNALNLNQKIYKPYYEFKTFQFVIIVPQETREKVKQLKKELGFTTDIKNWKFVFTTKEKITMLYNSLETSVKIDSNSYSSEVFIIDKMGFQRGRNDDKDTIGGKLYSYNAESVSFIHKKMVDDIKIVLEEYRRALKKNKKKEVFKNPYKENK